MNKTVHIHIKGVAFTMEEEAYALLKNYIERLTSSLGKQQGAEDIIEDIELRIAELLNEHTKKGIQIIEERHVTEVLATLGDPKDYADVNIDDEQPIYEESFTEVPSGRSLYRDTENAWIAGVCSGIASYLGIHVNLIRAALIAFVLLGGSGFIIYLVLWIVIPKPKTTLDRLRMQGKPINVESIKEEVNEASKQFKKSTSKVAEQFRNNEHLNDLGNTFGKILKMAVGVFLLILSFSLIIGFTFFLFSDQAIIKNNSSTFFTSFGMSELLFENNFLKNIAWFSVFAISGSILFSFLMGAVVLLFNINSKIWKYTIIAMTLIGFTGLITAIYVGIKTAKEYDTEVKIEEEIYKMNVDILTFKINETEKIENGRTIRHSNSSRALEIDKEYILENGYSVKYIHSKDSFYHVTILRTSRGVDNNKAKNRANNIQLGYRIDANEIMINNYFKYPVKDKIRDQEIQLEISIPKDKSVVFQNDTINFKPKQKEPSENFEETEFRGYVSRTGAYLYRND